MPRDPPTRPETPKTAARHPTRPTRRGSRARRAAPTCARAWMMTPRAENAKARDGQSDPAGASSTANERKTRMSHAGTLSSAADISSVIGMSRPPRGGGGTFGRPRPAPSLDGAGGHRRSRAPGSPPRRRPRPRVVFFAASRALPAPPPPRVRRLAPRRHVGRESHESVRAAHQHRQGQARRRPGGDAVPARDRGADPPRPDRHGEDPGARAGDAPDLPRPRRRPRRAADRRALPRLRHGGHGGGHVGRPRRGPRRAGPSPVRGQGHHQPHRDPSIRRDRALLGGVPERPGIQRLSPPIPRGQGRGTRRRRRAGGLCRQGMAGENRAARDGPPERRPVRGQDGHEDVQEGG